MKEEVALLLMAAPSERAQAALDAFETLLARPAWHDQAACRGADPDIFFPERGKKPDEARAYCQRCPVFFDCLDFALGSPTLQGVWAGTSVTRRDDIRRDAHREAS